MSPSSSHNNNNNNNNNIVHETMTMVLPPAPHSTPGRRRRRQQCSCSAPNSPVPPPSPPAAAAAQEARSNTQQQTTTITTKRRHTQQRLLFLSPRVGMSDDEIFPNAAVTTTATDKKKEAAVWKHEEEQRWEYVSEQAGRHRQDGSVLRVQRRMTPAALKVGMPSAAAARVKTLYLPPPPPRSSPVEHHHHHHHHSAPFDNDDKEQDHCKGLPEWLDVVTSKFPNLEHLYLMENETQDISRMDSSSNVGSAGSDDEEEVLTPSKSRRLRRLYVLYRLPDLLSIDGYPVTRQERQLARPQDPNGEKVNRDEWVDSSSEYDEKNDKNRDIIGENDTDSKADAASNPQNNNKGVAGDAAVEVCLSGSIKMTDIEEVGTRKDSVEKVCMPLFDDNDEKKEEGNVGPKVPRNMDPFLANLDQLEYVSVESSAHCDWGVACGSLSLPYFRPDSVSRIKDSVENTKSRFRISLRQRKGGGQEEQGSHKSLEKQSVTSKVERKLAAGGRRTHDLVDDHTEKTIQSSQSHEKKLISESRSYSENDVRAMLPKDTQYYNEVPGNNNMKKNAPVGNLEGSSLPLPRIGKKVPQIAQKKVAAGSKRDNVLFLLDDIEQTRSPRIQIGLVEQVQTSPRFQSANGVELKLTSPTRDSYGSQSPPRHQSADEAKLTFLLKKQEPSTQKIEKKLASGGSRSQSALLEVGERIDEIDDLERVDSTAGSVAAADTVNMCSTERLVESIAETPPRQAESVSSSPHTQDRPSLTSPPKPIGNLSGQTSITTGSLSRRIPASKSLTSPFPMQFRSRTCTANPPSPHRELERASFLQKKAVEAPLQAQPTPLPWKELKITTEVDHRGQIQEGPSPPPPPRESSPSLHTIDSVQPFRLIRVQSSPSKLGRRALLGDLPPPCPGGGRQRVVLPSPPRRLKPKQNSHLVKWRQKQTARSTSIMDNEEEDEFSSSDEENLELD